MRFDATPEFDRDHFILAGIPGRKGDLPGALAGYQVESAENPRADDVGNHMLDVKVHAGDRRPGDGTY